MKRDQTDVPINGGKEKSRQEGGERDAAGEV